MREYMSCAGTETRYVCENAQVLAGHEVGLTVTNPDDFCSCGEKAYE